MKKKDRIETKQLIYSAGCFILGSTLLTASLHRYGQHETWIVVLLGIAMVMPILWLYTVLANRFPGESLVEINRIVLGKTIGAIFSALYIFYFFSLAFLNVRDVGGFVGQYILPETPTPMVLILFSFVCCLAVTKGPKTFTRFSQLFVITTYLMFLFNLSLLLQDMDFQGFRPLFTLPVKKYFQGAHLVAVLPLGEVVAFFMLMPSMKKPAEAVRVFWRGLPIGAVLLLLNVSVATAVLGSLTSVADAPVFLTARSVDVGNILTRIEIVYAVNLIFLLFYKVLIVLYAVVTGISRLLRLPSYTFLTLTFGALAVIAALSSFDTGIEHAEWTTFSAPIYSTLFVVILPAVTAVVAASRGFFRKKAKT